MTYGNYHPITVLTKCNYPNRFRSDIRSKHAIRPADGVVTSGVDVGTVVASEDGKCHGRPTGHRSIGLGPRGSGDFAVCASEKMVFQL